MTQTQTQNTTFEEVLASRGTLVYTNKGISMRPLIKEGRDLVVIEPADPAQLKKYDVVLFKRGGQNGDKRYVLHRILKVKSEQQGLVYWVVGDNCTSGEDVLPSQILGVLTSVVQQGEEKQLKGLGYWLYTRIWVGWWPLRFFILRCRNHIR